jgi:3-oxoacyl-[acyl-carrier protein] reductase
MPEAPNAMSQLVEGQVAIVTGAGRGIGLATARKLSSQGASVVVSDMDRDAVYEAAASLGGDVAGHDGDLTQPGTAEALVNTAIERWGRLDIVVNNAGYTLDAPLHRLDPERFQRMLDIHVLAPFRVLAAAAPHLREPAKHEAAAGREVFRKVVNVSSLAGTMGNAGQANYAAAKAGVVGLTKTLAKEWGPLKVNVNAVAFGMIETRLSAEKDGDSVIEIAGRDIPVGIPAEAREALTSLIPLGRAGTADEAAAAVFFLCSPWSDYITGQVLTVSGGLPLGMAA